MTAEILNYAIEHGMVDLLYVEQQVLMDKRQRYLERHPYKIYLGKDGLWSTYLPDKKTKRKQVKRKERNKLEDVVVSYWEHREGHTLEEVFNEANERRLMLHKIQPATFTRNEQLFKKHFESIKDSDIRSITGAEICSFLENQLIIFDLSLQGFANLKGILRMIFKRAKKRGLSNTNIEETLLEVDVEDRQFKRKVVDDSKEVFYDDEVAAIVSYCKEHKDDVNCLGVALMFATGLRVGEVVALKREDIADGVIKVRRSETRYKKDGKVVYEVLEHAKTKAGSRNVIVPDSYLWVLDRLLKASSGRDFIFEGRSGRLHTQAVRKRLYQICKKLSLPVRSPHKARKTYGSILLDNGVDKNFIEKQMGHVDISCTENYYHRDRKKISDKRRILNSIPEFEGANEGVKE